VHHLPGVGENLRDHLHPRLQFEGKQIATTNDLLNKPWFTVREAVPYALFRERLFRTPSLKTKGFVRSPHAGEFPDVRFQLGLNSGISREVKDGVDRFSGFNLCCYDLYPTAMGSVHVVSADPRQPPHMFANYLGTERDLAVNSWALKFVRTVAAQAALREVSVERQDAPTKVRARTHYAFPRISMGQAVVCNRRPVRQAVRGYALRVQGSALRRPRP
jgi:choline dehydrogenase